MTNRSDTGDRIDLDNDGFYEILVVNKNSADDLFIFEASADNTYGQVWGVDVNSGTGSVVPQSLCVGDSDGDGNLEIVHVASGNLRVFEMSAGQIADGSNPSDTPVFFRCGQFRQWCSNRQFGWRTPMLNCCFLPAKKPVVFLIIENTGNNTYAAAVSTDVGNTDMMNNDGGAATLSRAVDLDNDGTLEVVLAPDREARSNNAFYVFTWDGSSFTQEATLPLAGGSNSGINNVLIYDLDGSGNPEIIISESVNDLHFIFTKVPGSIPMPQMGARPVFFSFTNMNIYQMTAGDRDSDGFFELYVPIDDDSVSTNALAVYFEHDGTAGGFAAGNFGSAQTLISDIGNGSGSNDPRGLAYAQGSFGRRYLW